MIMSHLRLLLNICCAVLSFTTVLGGGNYDAEADRIISLPGLTYESNFAQYSGFLRTKAGNFLHYWLIESQNKPSSDPLVLWLNGQPGCSSLDGLFAQIGPFRVAQDGETLFENIYSWNKAANLIFLESFRDVGYSYRNASARSDMLWNDDKTVEDSADALEQFFQRFKEYQNRDFYITGQSYVGIYGPALMDLLIKRIQQKGNPYGIRLAGLAIGNGAYNEVDRRNSIITLQYYKGMLDKEKFNSLSECCATTPPGPLSYCNFSQYINWTTYEPIDSSDCASKVVDLAFNIRLNNSFNSNQDCYIDTSFLAKNKVFETTQRQTELMKLNDPETEWSESFIDQGSLINMESTDAQYTFPCWMKKAMVTYLNLPAVRKVLHIPDNLPPWSMCSKKVLSNYKRQHLDMTPVFESIINTLPIYPFNNVRFLIYNGDADMEYNFLSNEWFVTRLTDYYPKSDRSQWIFQENPRFLGQLAGYFQQFFINDFVTIDFLTIKGGGQFAPLDRAGPSLHMFTNFIQNLHYNVSFRWDTTAKPILPQYRHAPKINPTRKQRDRVWNLPGLTFEPEFKQYSGYLNGGLDIHLHYWLVESQRNPAEDPLILWLNGGTGCSLLHSFFSENGPFRPNPDNMTLSENNYSWNKIANMLFLESSFVGFSWQNDSSRNDDFDFNNEKTTEGVFHALMDFLTVFPEYINRTIYITGQSYAAVHILNLSAFIIDQIQIGNSKELNLAGIAIGNGMLSRKEQFNSLMTMLFYRGIHGYDRHLKLMECCKNRNISQPIAYCDFSQYVKFDKYGNVTPVENNTCASYIVSSAYDYMWQNQKMQNVYNLYENYYHQNGLLGRKRFSLVVPATYLSVHANQRSKINYNSIDGKGNLYWHESLLATTEYLNHPDVRTALHILPAADKWTACNSSINPVQQYKYNDTSLIFQRILNSSHPLNIMIYNGDVDPICQFLGDEWFIENTAKMHSMNTIQQRAPWTYRSQIVGYEKTFQSPSGTLQFVTVKDAGHFVSLDHPGPALQMMNNFLEQTNLSIPIPVSTKPSPLKKQYRIMDPITAGIGTSHNSTKQFNREDEADDNMEMPGRTFMYDLKTETGYLEDGQGNNLFFWWIPSANQSAPLIIWLGDGPGCSVLYDVFSNIGLYRVGASGEVLYENPFSWDRVANMLFLEAMTGTGYSPKVNIEYSDDQVVSGLLNAIENFYKIGIGFNFRRNPLYIFGQGYGGRYALFLARKLADSVFEIPLLRGIGLGNSLLDYETLINIMPNQLYYNNLLGKDEWDQLIPCCQDENGIYQESCHLLKYVSIDGHGVVTPKTDSKCAQFVAHYANKRMSRLANLSLNMYQNCYEGKISVDYNNNQAGEVKRQVSHFGPQPLTNNFSFINQQLTEAYPCYMDSAISTYLRLDAVQKWFNISDNTPEWQICNPSLSYNIQFTTDMSKTIKAIIEQYNKIDILVFDGDSYLGSNFLSNAIFLETLAKEMEMRVTEQNPFTYQERNAGFVRSFTHNLTETTIHLLALKGAGYHIGLDQPAVALQMIANFLGHPGNETQETPQLRQILPQYEPEEPQQVSRREADEIFDLPGLTYAINFRQYSGFLKATEGNYLHYWFVESQNDPSNDPVIIWFNGGPGCSSMAGLLMENGPFHTNPDGITLFENVFSWNKMANVLYIDSPRQVGFSYQNHTINPSSTFNDALTNIDIYIAILDFFTVFSNFKNNHLYIAGESYASVYVLRLATHIIREIQINNVELSLKGIVVGNGYFSTITDVRSISDYLHFHAIYGKEVWDQLQQCCPQRYEGKPTVECSFEDYILITDKRDIVPRPEANQTCAHLVVSLATTEFLETVEDPYNIYQDCYQETEPILPFRYHHHKHILRSGKRQNKAQTLRADANTAYRKPWPIHTRSTDALGGFPCYMYRTTTNYLNQAYVRNALHIPAYIQPYELCSSAINAVYSSLDSDTTPLLQQLLDSNYPLRALFYNGDADTACNFLGVEWFVEQFSKSNNMNTSEKDTWLYRLGTQRSTQIAGYKKIFEKNELKIDFATVKGAGHMVPITRSGPVLQLLTNFVRQNDYDDALLFSLNRQPLLSQFNRTTDISRKIELSMGTPQISTSTLVVNAKYRSEWE